MQTAPTNTTNQGGSSVSTGTGEQITTNRKKPKEEKQLVTKILEIVDRYLAEVSSPQLLNEISYTAYQRSISENSPKQKVNKSLRLLARKLNEIEQLIYHSKRFKESLTEGEWSIQEDVRTHLLEKTKTLYREIKNI